MSLKEAYTLAHTAQCRLNIAINKPHRNLRFVVGHLNHYESLRLRIIEIEHDVSHRHGAKAVQFRGTGHVDQPELRRPPSTGQLGGRKSPPPPSCAAIADEDDEDDIPADLLAEDVDDELSLQRFPSGSARPPQPPPELVPDDPDDNDDEADEPTTPEEPDEATIEQAMKGHINAQLAKDYELIRSCRCHGKGNEAPPIENIWELPKDEQTKPGVTRAVAEIAVES